MVAAVTDRATVVLLTLAVFLVLLGVLAREAESGGNVVATRPVTVLRKIYETKVIETVPANSNVRAGVSQSVSGSAAPIAAPTTRTS